MKRNSFTLVEMLVVIGVIAILMGILFPTLGVIREKANVKQSQTEVKAIQIAIQSFKNEYHYLPDTTTANDVAYFGSLGKATPAASDKDRTCANIFEEEKALPDDYINLFNTLCYSNSDPTKSYVPSDDSKALNPRKIKFLSPSKKFVHSETTQRGYRDPWGRPYIIYLDTNYDGKILLPAGCGLPDNTFYGDVAVIGQGSYEGGKLGDALKKPEQIVTSWQ